MKPKRMDGRTKKARSKKWIKEQRAFGKRFKIDKSFTETHIRMKLKGFENIAGLDKKGLKSFGYTNTPKIKVIKKRNKDYYTIWRKK